MADEDLASVEEAEAQEIAPDTEDQASDTPDPIADLASEMGWVPKDRFRGDPDKWRPADEFIRAGHDIQKTLSRDLKGVRQEVERFGRVAADITEERVNAARAQWEQSLARAVDEGDTEAALKLARQEPKAPQATAPDPQVTDWVARNDWFNKDVLAASRAREITDRLAREGYDVATQLAEAEKAVRRERPDLFPSPTKQPPATQTGASRKAAPSNRARGFADMPAESQQMAKDMVRRNPSVTLEAIASSYWADVEKSRRVG